jgi:membrane fusion protein (multidrug efflux system)
MRFSKSTVAVAAAVVLVGAGGAYWLFGGSAARGPVGPGAGTLVVAAPAVVGDVALTFDAVGTLRANEAVTVTCKTTGIVKSIHFDEGQQVKEGQVLVELDDNEARANLAVA